MITLLIVERKKRKSVLQRDAVILSSKTSGRKFRKCLLMLVKVEISKESPFKRKHDETGKV